MRWLGTFVTALLLSSHIQAAEQKPWKCVTVKSVGAKTTDGEIRPVSFTDQTEFRIKPLGAWADDLTGNEFLKGMLQMSIDSATEKAGVGVSLIRKVSQDPQRAASWGACKVNEMPTYGEEPAYNLIFCESVFVLNGELRLNTSTGRYTLASFGDWHGTVKGEKPTQNSWFDFGTCSAYYD